MLEFGASSSIWSFEPAITLLKSAAGGEDEPAPSPTMQPDLTTPLTPIPQHTAKGGLGDFTEIWKELGVAYDPPTPSQPDVKLGSSVESDTSQLVKAVKWRDEQDGADLEDNVEPEQVTASNLRTRKRAARRARARERELQLAQGTVDPASDTATDDESGEELESLRRSPDRRSLIADLVGRPRPTETISPPTSPSPPKTRATLQTPTKKLWPISNPFLWSAPSAPSPASKNTIIPIDGLNGHLRKLNLISQLSLKFPDESKYLSNQGCREPAFSPLNTSSFGIHVFIDFSNISIGFHDCLKVARGIPITNRVRRVPLNFHNLSLVLERGRPAAKRVLCGSERTSTVDQAEACGYEANVLDRVHKVKTPTSKKKYYPGTNGGGYHSASGVSHGETSGSETPMATYKWSEQAVDEIVHLKMSHSILDAEKPSTIVLATGDAAEAEYSDGFLRMVERALRVGWSVELISFKQNTSSLYKRKEFRQKWGPMFKWIQLDDFVESLIDEGS
ncbi:hypothetical protein PMZ80_004951 [Knufia obscura]|uniref:NYN domain-containing protein n=2 Tax=Knufia TaxID=430999 RepID=A0AAN8F028_9EURO|nr:hypothetical protein PMZ80_004951 [Knufia obscura]KAK5957616.1 hypothetical protein OHC33_000803 [Knufia fluminis]